MGGETVPPVSAKRNGWAIFPSFISFAAAISVIASWIVASDQFASRASLLRNCFKSRIAYHRC